MTPFPCVCGVACALRQVAMAQKGFLPALIECGRDAVDGWLNHSERAQAACASGAPEPPAWPRISCRAVVTMPPPSPPPPAGRRLLARSKRMGTGGKASGKAGGGKAGGGEGGAAGGASSEAGRAQEKPLETRCQTRRESVMPLEKSGFYSQAAGYCATLYPFSRGPCTAAATAPQVAA